MLIISVTVRLPWNFFAINLLNHNHHILIAGFIIAPIFALLGDIIKHNCNADSSKHYSIFKDAKRIMKLCLMAIISCFIIIFMLGYVKTVFFADINIYTPSVIASAISPCIVFNNTVTIGGPSYMNITGPSGGGNTGGNNGAGSNSTGGVDTGVTDNNKPAKSSNHKGPYGWIDISEEQQITMAKEYKRVKYPGSIFWWEISFEEKIFKVEWYIARKDEVSKINPQHLTPELVRERTNELCSLNKFLNRHKDFRDIFVKR